MLKIPLLGLTTVTAFSAVVLGAERKKECMVPIKTVAREITSYLDSVSLINLSGVDIMMHWECRNELALRLSGDEAMMGQAHPIDFIRCNDECTLFEWMDHYANSDKRAAITLNDYCHLVRGMPPTLDPIYNGEFSVKHRIQMERLGKLSANPSKRGQWVTYTNRDDEWIACKLNDDLEMEKEFNLKQPNKRSFRIVGSNYVISQTWTKDIGGTFKLYEFSDQSGIGNLIGTVTVPPRSNPVIREAEDGGLPTIVYVNTKVDKDGKLICTVHTQSFIDGEHSSETVIDLTGWGITSEFINSLTTDAKYVITTHDLYLHSDRFTVSDAVSGEIKIKGKVPFERSIQDSDKDYTVKYCVSHNERYCVVSSDVWCDPETVQLHGLFDLDTGEQMGPFIQVPFTKHSHFCRWASDDVYFFRDENLQYYMRSVHSPQIKIPFQIPDYRCFRNIRSYAFLENQHELLFIDWKKLQ